MKIIKKIRSWKWHWTPYCCAEKANSKHLFDGKNYLWLKWMFCFN